MNNKTIKALKDLALEYEKNDDIEVAYDLMRLARQARPEALFLKQKCISYRKELVNRNPHTIKLRRLVESGEIAIIPIGFRCHTAKVFSKKAGVELPSLPFSSGFFPPESLVSVFQNPKVDLQFDDQGKSHAVAIKTEGYEDAEYGLGIKFESSDYQAINSLASSPEIEEINKYLDSTYGYYTIDKTHKFVLAHYNWHPFSSPQKSGGITDPAVNLKNINEMMNRRISRMLMMCEKAKHIFFVYHEGNRYKSMWIDDERMELGSFKEFDDFCSSSFGSKYSRVNTDEIISAKRLLALYRKAQKA